MARMRQRVLRETRASSQDSKSERRLKEKEQEDTGEAEEEEYVPSKRKGLSGRMRRNTWDEGQERQEDQVELMQHEMCELDHLITMPLVRIPSYIRSEGHKC